MNPWTNWFASFLLSMLPFAVLIGFWMYFMKKLRRQPELLERNFQHMDRVEALLERIAKATEDRKASERESS
jgi:ATP-dependent Zn protease